MKLDDLIARAAAPVRRPGRPRTTGELLYGRLRLSLNLHGLPFPARLGAAEREALHAYVLGRQDLLDGLELRTVPWRSCPRTSWSSWRSAGSGEPGGMGSGDAELLLASDEHGGLLVGRPRPFEFPCDRPRVRPAPGPDLAGEPSGDAGPQPGPGRGPPGGTGGQLALPLRARHPALPGVAPARPGLVGPDRRAPSRPCSPKASATAPGRRVSGISSSSRM
jgi:hypothetical protein